MFSGTIFSHLSSRHFRTQAPKFQISLWFRGPFKILWMLLSLAHEAVQTLWLGEPWSWSGEGCSWASPGRTQNNWIPKVPLLNPCKVTFPPWFNKQVYLPTRSQSFLSLLREELMSREVHFIWKIIWWSIISEYFFWKCALLPPLVSTV